MYNIYLSRTDTKFIKSLVPESMAELVNRKMSIGDADKVRQYLTGKTEDSTINILLYGSRLAKKVNFYNNLIGGNHR